MSIPLYAWVAYVYKAVAIQSADVVRMSIATSLPHMDKSDRAKVYRNLEESIAPVKIPEKMSKEEYVAQLGMLGIGVELN